MDKNYFQYCKFIIMYYHKLWYSEVWRFAFRLIDASTGHQQPRYLVVQDKPIGVLHEDGF